MKHTLYILLITLFFNACEDKQNITEEPQAKVLFDSLPNTLLVESSFSELPNFTDENYAVVLDLFLNNCSSKKSKKLYGSLCKKASSVEDAKGFLRKNFIPYMVHSKESQSEGLLTGYYEAHLFASKKRSKKYKYPIYETPNDLIVVDLSSIYPGLKKYRLRGKIKGNKLVPYDTRAESKKKKVNADVVCYCDSKVDRFFLEIQGSGRVTLDDRSTMFIGYDNQNGYKYRAIGRYLVKIGALRLKDVSLQSIRKWLDENPSRVDEVLNYNRSIVYFKERHQGATGALGLKLRAKRSVAVDRKYIPLGSMLYLSANVDDTQMNRVVFAQDTGGAIKGAVRADLFLGYGKDALSTAGRLKSKLQLWIILPKNKKRKLNE